MIIYVYFFLTILAISGAFIAFAKWTSLIKCEFAKPLSTGMLIVSFSTFAVGLLEALLLLSTLLPLELGKKPIAPEFLIFHKSPKHILLKKSILYINMPNNEFMTLGNRVSTNLLGFRERKFEFKKNKGVFRILVFGSSYTFGQAISVDQRYSNQLEELLNTRNDSMKFEVLNFGMPGYNFDQIHELMKVILGHVECDLIVLGIPVNDLSITTRVRLVHMTNLGREKLRVISEIKLPQIFQNLSRNLVNIPEREPKNFQRPVFWIKNTQIFKAIEKRTQLNESSKLPNFERWTLILKEFKGMIQLAKSNGLPPIIASLLYQGAVESKQNNFLHPRGDLAKNIRLLQFIGNELQEIGFKIADPLPFFQEYSGMSLIASEWDAHPNYLSHYLYAKSIMKLLNTKFD
jgi:hypothetical protein